MSMDGQFGFTFGAGPEEEPQEPLAAVVIEERPSSVPVRLDLAVNVDLFGNPIDEFKSAKERYGVWPVTVWDCDMQDGDTRCLKELIGDNAEQRLEARAAPGANSVYQNKQGSNVSIFNPAVAAWCLNLYAPQQGVCYDPFAGGGTRAIMAAKHGLAYVGCEIREGEIGAVQERCQRAGVAESVALLHKDSRDCGLPDEYADYLLTCPPYYDLEQYNGGDRDLSMLPMYSMFCGAISQVIRECYRILKPGSIACWIVGLMRDSKGGLRGLHHDIARLHVSAGFVFKEEIVLAQRNNGAIQRVGMFENGNKFLVRTHEYLLVFVRP